MLEIWSRRDSSTLLYQHFDMSPIEKDAIIRQTSVTLELQQTDNIVAVHVTGDLHIIETTVRFNWSSFVKRLLLTFEIYMLHIGMHNLSSPVNQGTFAIQVIF